MTRKYKHKYNCVLIYNRWKSPTYSRNGSWVYLGISKYFFNATEYRVTLHLFGIDIQFWFERKLKQPNVD